MDQKTIEELIDLQDKEIYFLSNELLMSNNMLDLEIKIKDPESRELNYEDIKPHLGKGTAISQIIKRRHVIEREDYFFNSARLFCDFIKNEAFELAEKKYKELLYFQHSFLEDSELKRIKIHHEILREALPY